MGVLRPAAWLLSSFFSYTILSQAATVSIDLQAPWPTHTLSPFLEAAEFLHTVDEDLFWAYLSHVGHTQNASLADRGAAFTAAVSSAAHVLHKQGSFVSSGIDALLQLLKVSLEFRAHAPAVEQQRRLSDTTTAHALRYLGVSVPELPPAWILLQASGALHYITSIEQLEEILPAVKKACADAAEVKVDAAQRLKVYPFDHETVPLSGEEGSGVVVVVNGLVGAPAFRALLEGALGVECGRVVVRLGGGQPVESEPTFLQGFGATLDIKNMEYITVDESQQKEEQEQEQEQEVEVEVEQTQDGAAEAEVKGVSFAKLKQRYPSKTAELDSVREQLRKEEEAEELDAAAGAGKLKVWEMAKLGLQVTQRILKAPDPLQAFEDIVGNFPLRAPRLSKLKVSSKLKRAAKSAVPLGAMANGVVYVNGLGLHIGLESFNIFSALETIKKEVKLANDLRAVGLDTADAVEKFVGVMGGAAAEKDEEDGAVKFGLRVDVRKGGKGSILFLNNIEKDSRYASWPTQVQMLLQGARQIVPIRKNLYTMIVVLDPLVDSHRSALKSLLYFIEIGVPVRIGLVFSKASTADETDADACDDVCFTKLYLRAKQESSGRAGAVSLLQALADAEEKTISKKEAINMYAASIAKASGSWTKSKFVTDAKDALASTEGDETVEKMRVYTKSKGFTVPSWSLNGLVKESIANIDREFTQVVFEEQRNLMVEVWYGNVKDKTDVLKYILTKAGAVPRYNPLILQPKDKQTFVKIPYVKEDLASVQYADSSSKAKLTLWVIVDLFTSTGKDLLLSAMAFSKEAGAKSRVALFPQNQASARAWKSVFEADEVKQAVEALCVEEVDASSVEDASPPMTSLAMSMCKEGSCVVANGRVLSIPADSAFGVDEFKMLVASEMEERVSGVQGLLQETLPDVSSDLLLSASSLAGAVLSQERQFIDSSEFPDEVSELTLSLPGGNQSFLSVKAVVNPLTAEAQKIASVLRLLHMRFNCKVEVVLLPEISVSSFPLQNFYRFAGVEEKEESVLYPSVEFEGMPRSQLLTLKVFTPEYWIVYPYDTGDVDTDNIRLEAEGDVHASFILKSLLVTGHAHEADTNVPPAGMQLELYTDVPQSDGAQDLYSDTLVMNNLGYFQLQANPGVWRMQLAEGPSRSIYEVTQDHSVDSDYERVVLLRDFTGNVEDLEVRKRPGKEEMRLLESLDEKDAGDGGLWKSMASKLFEQKVEGEEDETIHVFSLASGALYERFIRIMMVSVASATKSPLKFWIIENFLSPRFKKTIGKLAEAYGFDYALVTYRWPYWLHGQTEKQRIIWGYKILFLDVLFPLNLRKVIYVDADQVVRADLKELWDMDLKGRPYGYTPFCDSRKETLGFQFWRSGYWKDHLRGRPYHISALYVVDLVVFRKMAVGDRLRAIYDSLSRDPNSLSNLDQDLPNYAQNMVPIFSLPQEWLWCESWCSDGSKKRAKTIDLCNNPLHKEPKLDMAKRVISGPLFKKSWVELDEEIEAIISK